MRSVVISSALAAPALLFCLSACGGAALDYETAMELMRERASEPVRTTITASPRFENQDPKVIQAYQRLIEAHVIQCRSTAVGAVCEPGPAGDTLTQNGVGDISMIAGRWVPASIVGIQRTGSSSASADVRMAFEPGPLFQEFETALDSVLVPGSMIDAAVRKQGKVVHASFQHYEDGWHVESVE